MEMENRQEQDQFESLIQGLIDNKYGCSNDFFLPPIMAGLRQNIHDLNESGKLKRASIGNKSGLQTNLSIRSDTINWIADQGTNAFEIVYLQKIWRFIHYMNKTCFTSIKTYESHYANFEIGRFYKRHLDQFKSDNGRKFSIVLYLNEDWLAEDAGSLSLYPSIGENVMIAPLSGRLVFFRSDEMEHEVHPSMTRERCSIAGWLKN